ncbi:MAG: hypothetical protein NT013_19715 [Planctomycetia bacterium]|nr:hypothetical protein [Planctomycetia bacterium]
MQRKHRFWEPVIRHRLFLASLTVIAPAVGYLISSDRGLLFGVGICIFSAIWLIWSGYDRAV